MLTFGVFALVQPLVMRLLLRLVTIIFNTMILNERILWTSPAG